MPVYATKLIKERKCTSYTKAYVGECIGLFSTTPVQSDVTRCVTVNTKMLVALIISTLCTYYPHMKEKCEMGANHG